MPSMQTVMAGYAPPDDADILQLEQLVQRQLLDPSGDHLKLLGYGEFTIAVAHPRQSPVWACKRLPPAPAAQARRFADHIGRYIAMLEGAGLNVVPTGVHITPASGGGDAIWLSQPILPKDSLGPEVLRARAPSGEDEVLCAILAAVKGACTSKFGVDGHLANWAWLDGQPWFFDISTPFNQDERDRPELDVSLLIRPYPAFVRPLLRAFVAPDLLNRYYDLRLTYLEFAGVLHREGLAAWIPAVVEAANRLLETPISVDEVNRFYAKDTGLWDLIYWMKRLERRLTKLSGRTYQFLISPPIARYVKAPS